MPKQTLLERFEKEEYAFGPWLIEITNEDLIPVQYLAYKNDILNSQLTVKFPINVDRKDVKIGMVLYKDVLIFEDDHLKLLAYTDDDINEIKIPYEDITFIVNGGELLVNYIEIATTNRIYRIDYYSISENVVPKMLNLMRKYFHEHQDVQLPGPLKTKEYELKPLYQYFIQKERFESQISIVDYHPTFYGNKHFNLLGHKITNRFFRSLQEDLVFMTNGAELIIASVDVTRRHDASVNYSFCHAYIKKDRITDIKKENNPNFYQGKQISFYTKHTKKSFNVHPNFVIDSLIDIID